MKIRLAAAYESKTSNFTQLHLKKIHISIFLFEKKSDIYWSTNRMPKPIYKECLYTKKKIFEITTFTYPGLDISESTTLTLQ